MNIFFFYSLFFLISILMFIKEPMQLLLTIMAFMLILIMKMFLESLDYWTMFIMILSFIVGLFLMFVYMVSFSKKQIYPFSILHFFNFNLFKNNFFLMVILLLTFLSLQDTGLISSFSSSQMSTFSWYEKWTQEKSEIVMFFIIAFFFLVMLMFYLMKKAKKSMKSSV